MVSQASIMLEEMDKLHSIGYKILPSVTNILTVVEILCSLSGEKSFFFRLSIIHKEEESHSLPSDLSSLINDQQQNLASSQQYLGGKIFGLCKTIV
jgi:hypothetical protein